VMFTARQVGVAMVAQGWRESIDMANALHLQTLITYGRNGGEPPSASADLYACTFPVNSATRASNTSTASP
jgi:hypothetical protein